MHAAPDPAARRHAAAAAGAQSVTMRCSHHEAASVGYAIKGRRNQHADANLCEHPAYCVNDREAAARAKKVEQKEGRAAFQAFDQGCRFGVWIEPP